MDNFDLLNISPCAIIAFNNEGVITNVNSTLLDKLQYTVDDLIGNNVEKIFTLSTRIFYQTHLFPLLKLHGKADEIFVTLLAKNRESVPVLINAVSTIHNNIPVNICACITVYERKKYEDEILAAKKVAEEALTKNVELQKAKQDLEAGREELDKQVTELRYRNKELQQLNDLIAHDLQEPVRKIRLFTDLIINNDENTLEDKSLKHFDIISRSSARMQNVLRSLQDYMHTSTSNLNKNPVDLSILLRDQINIVAASYPAIKYTLSISPLPVISGDYLQLQILFYNLIKNSFVYRSTERDLKISISCTSMQHNLYNSTENKYKYVDFAAIQVEDNGIGFNADYRELIFKILKKLDVKSSGLGFGLALCRRISENHRGKISATSIEGKGSTFTITLPFK